MLNYSRDESGGAPLDQVFHALADPARRSMLERLGAGPCSLGALAKPLPMSLPAALQHLRVLEHAGLVATHKSGRVRQCTLRAEALAAAADWLGERRREWELRLDRLEDYLATLPPDGEPHGPEK